MKRKRARCERVHVLIFVEKHGKHKPKLTKVIATACDDNEVQGVEMRVRLFKNKILTFDTYKSFTH